MTTPTLLYTRPTDELARGRAAAAAAGFRLLAAPLLEIEELPFVLPQRDFDALLFTSPRAPPLVAARAPELRRLPCCAVGPRSAASAIRHGFDVVLQGSTDGTAIVGAAARHGFRRLLQPGGEQHIDIPAPAGLSLTPLAVYRAVAAGELGTGAAEALRSGALFASLLFSPRSAAIFAGLLDAARIGRQKLRLVALSANVAAAAGPGWQAVAIARLPNLNAALRSAAALWQQERPAGDGT